MNIDYGIKTILKYQEFYDVFYYLSNDISFWHNFSWHLLFFFFHLNPLHLAVIAGNYEITEYFINNGLFDLMEISISTNLIFQMRFFLFIMIFI